LKRDFTIITKESFDLIITRGEIIDTGAAREMSVLLSRNAVKTQRQKEDYRAAAALPELKKK
jgi:hypothetical protein